MSRTLLHAATDWPGHYPNNAATVRALIEAGADVDARFTGPHTETPLHWTASSNDVEVMDVLLDAGADIEAPGAVIAGGTPLADATGFGQWDAARRLIERGARSNLFESAAMGLLDRVEAELSAEPPPEPDAIDGAFWAACHGGQLATAQRLLRRAPTSAGSRRGTGSRPWTRRGAAPPTGWPRGRRWPTGWSPRARSRPASPLTGRRRPSRFSRGSSRPSSRGSARS